MKIRHTLSRLSAVCLLTGLIGVSAAQAQSYPGDSMNIETPAERQQNLGKAHTIAPDIESPFSATNSQQSVMNEPGQPNAPRTVNPNTPQAQTVPGNTSSTTVIVAPATTPNAQQNATQNSQTSQQRTLQQTTPQTTLQQKTVDPKSVPKAYRGYDPANNPEPIEAPTIRYIVEPANTQDNTSTTSQTRNSETLGPDVNVNAGDIYPYLADGNDTETTRIDRSERVIVTDDADDADSSTPFNALYLLLFTIIAISVVAAVYMVRRYRTDNSVRPLR